METSKIFLSIIIWSISVTCGKETYSKLQNDPMELIIEAGFQGQDHRVQTPDGYVLTLHRLLPAPAQPLSARRRRPVFLQHGFWSSSYNWLAPGPKNALPFILSMEGYDVWMGNSRGNIISRDHVSLQTNSEAFWDFSFHEMGLYDLPAVIDYILNATGVTQLHYIGHSMGTTMFFVMASLRPDIAVKVVNMVALAPVATVRPLQNYLRMFILLQKSLIMGNTQFEFLTRNGISSKTVLHFMQLYLTGNFSMYDYGTRTNMQKYNSSVPPFYKISEISIPVLICYGTDDPFATFEDVRSLQFSLGAAEDVWQFPFNHLEFVEGRSTKSLLFDKIIHQLHLRWIFTD